MVSSLLKFSLSFGTFCIVKKTSVLQKLCFVRLPSSKIIAVSVTTKVVLGRNDNIFHNKQRFSNYFSGRQSLGVRGVAKNPVDHPNGGRSKTKQPLKTPWGTIAKKNK